jgi:photosystem II stability/assembly factor-like uncharacterized protein
MAKGMIKSIIARSPRIPSVCLLAVTLFSALAGRAEGQTWQPLGPLGGLAQVMDVSGAKAFAYVGGHFFRTTDNGEHWVRLDKGRVLGSVRNMARLGPHLFVGSWTGVYRSGDGGETWTKLPLISSVTSVEAMFVHRGSLLVVNRANGGLYRYSDSGVAWTPLVVKAPDAFAIEVKNFAGDDSALYVGGKGLLKSLDGGTTWKDLSNGLFANHPQPHNPSGHVRSLLAGNGGLYAGVEGAVYRSVDGGSTFSPLLVTDSTTAFSFLALAGDALLAGTMGGGLWRIPLDSSPPSRIEGFPDILYSLHASDSAIFAGTSEGVLRSDDGGKTWSTKNLGIRAYNVGALAAKNGTLHAAGGTISGITRSLDNGLTWEPGVGLPEAPWRGSLTWNGNTLFAPSAHQSNRIYASEDGGMHWTTLTGIPDSLVVESLAAWAGSLYATTYHTGTHAYALLRSEDQGRSWRPASEPIDGGKRWITSVAFGGSWIHVGTDSGYFRIEAATGKVKAYRLDAFYVQKMFAWEGGLLAYAAGSDIRRSLDQGLTWEKAVVAAPMENYVTAFAGNAQAVYAGTYGSGIHRSTNGGASWEPFAAGESDPLVYSLVLDGGWLYAGTSASIYRLDLGGGTGILSGRQLESGKGGKAIGMESLLGKRIRLPYLQAPQADGRLRIVRPDGRQAADGIPPR